MHRTVYRYQFGREVASEDVEASLVLAILGTEALCGESQTRLDAAHAFDPEKRACVIDADTEVGVVFNRLFCQFLRREYGEDSFTVRRLVAERARPHEKARAACA